MDQEYLKSEMDDYFKNGDEFYMNLYEEHIREKCIFHAHEFIELCYVYQGCGYHVIDKKKYNVKKGDLFIIEQQIPHTFYHDENEKLITYNVMFKPELFRNNIVNFSTFGTISLVLLFSNLDEGDCINPVLELMPKEQMKIESVLCNMYDEFLVRDDGYTDIINLYMIELIIHIMRITKYHSVSDKKTFKNKDVVNHIVDFLNEKFSTGFDLNELAMNCFYSKNYLCSIFKENTGLSMSQYLQRIRIKKACELLSSTDIKITEISSITGFPDYKSFFTAFKKITGISPKEFRQGINKKAL